MADLYANENFPQSVVDGLRSLGHDVLTVLESGQSDRAWPDPEVLTFAVAQYRAVLTLNRRHFIRLHLEQPNHRGIIVCTFDSDFPAQAARIHEAIESAGTLERKLLRVNRSSA